MNKTRLHQALLLVDLLLIDLGKTRRMLPILAETARNDGVAEALDSVDSRLRLAVIELGGVRDWFEGQEPANGREVKQ